MTFQESTGDTANKNMHGIFGPLHTRDSDKKKLLAVIGVYTSFGSRLKRNIFRGSWMPRGDALK